MFPGADGLIGREFGGYRLERVLGSGGAGAVFLGRRPESPQDQAAVKVLIPPMQLGVAEREEFRARFRREAQALQQLQHPHVLAVRALGEDPTTGLPYMLLPYIDGGTLATRIARGPLPLTEAGQYLAQVADALDYAHSRGVVHRDIKPANILLDQQGQVFLADFGLVKLFDGTRTTLTTTGQVMGTPEYMSPEQARGDQIGPAADIYSLGVVLYQMVTGRLPFQAKSLTDMLLQIVQSAPPPPRELRPDLPEPVNATILRALAKAPDARIASAGELWRSFDLGIRGEWAPGLQPLPQPLSSTMPVILPPTLPAAPSNWSPATGIQAVSPSVSPPAPPQPWQGTVSGAPPFAQPNGQGMIPPAYDPRLGQAPAPILGTPSYGGGGGQGASSTGPAHPRAGGANRIALYLLAALVVLSLSGVGIYLRVSGGTGGNGGNGPGGPGGPGGTASVGGHVITNQHFKIATELPVSGADASIGLPTQYGVDLAVSQNTDLGNGNTLSVVHEDDAGTTGLSPTQGASNVQQLIADPSVMAIVGPFNSGVAIAEIPLVNSDGIVEISPTNTNPGLTVSQYAPQYGIDFSKLHPAGSHEYYFRLPGNDVAQGKADALFALQTLNARSAYVVDDNEAYGKGLATFFAQSYTSAGGSVLGRVSLSSQSDFGSVAQTIAAAHPAVVFYGGVTSLGGAQLKKALVGAGYAGPMLGGDGIAEDPAWQQMAGSAASNTYGTISAPDMSIIPPSFTSAYNGFAASKPSNTLEPYTLMAYDAAIIEIKAIKSLIAAGTPVTRAYVRDMVAQSSTKSALGGNVSIAFDSNGDNTTPIFSVYQTDSTTTATDNYQESRMRRICSQRPSRLQR